MGTDISEGAKVGIILIILCALIAIVFSLLTMMKNITASGSQSLQNGLDQLSDSEFQNYDQKNVSGTDVAAAVKIFEGRPVSFVVYTSADQKGSGGKGHIYGAFLGNDNNKFGTEGNNGGSNAGKTFEIPITVGGTDPGTGTYTGQGITKYDGDSFYTSTLYTDASGSVQYNMNVRPMSVTGKRTYVRSSAKFLAELIKDPTGTKIGACFTQMN